MILNRGNFLQKIGTQTWMAQNLNYNASGSKCGSVLTGSGTVVDANTATCDKYGRLYDWSTAMGISSSYNSNSYNPSANTNYRGVCPTGWHIPNNAEWDKLMRSVDGSTGTSSPYNSPTAGRYLKATDGWYNCGKGSSYSYQCEDTYGFSALPGGLGYSVGSFYDVGDGGNWWSSSEDGSSNAYLRYMVYYDEYVYYLINGKDYLRSVRCLQD